MLLTRRDWLLGCAAVAVTAPWSMSGRTQPAIVAEGYADAAAADRWMQSWIEPVRAADPSATKAPNGAMHLGRFADPMYYLTSVIGWDPEPKQANAYQSVRVPIGFVTDFASIPRIFWSLLPPDGLYSYAAVIHDFLYWEQYLTRETSDAIFKMCMEDFKINAALVAAIHAAVRIGGGFAWEENARRRAAGEKRILRRFPTDPRLAWTEWSQDAKVFQE